MTLRAALANITTDRTWWRTLLIGGALFISIFGAPLAAGYIINHYELIRRGYPRPLPPWVTLGDLYVLGLLALLVDVVFFVLPAGIVLGLLVIIGLTGSAVGLYVLGGALLLWWAVMWIIGVSPVGRLLICDDGGPERALGGSTLRQALNPQQRSSYLRARFQSIPAYLPVVLVANVIFFLPFGFGTLVLIWLAACLMFGAHLVSAQLYGATTRTPFVQAIR